MNVVDLPNGSFVDQIWRRYMMTVLESAHTCEYSQEAHTIWMGTRLGFLKNGVERQIDEHLKESLE
jgi:hypothetical protein